MLKKTLIAMLIKKLWYEKFKKKIIQSLNNQTTFELIDFSSNKIKFNHSSFIKEILCTYFQYKTCII